MLCFLTQHNFNIRFELYWFAGINNSLYLNLLPNKYEVYNKLRTLPLVVKLLS